MNFCPSCGVQSVERANYCHHCGFSYLKSRKAFRKDTGLFLNRILKIDEETNRKVTFGELKRRKNISHHILESEYLRLLSKDGKHIPKIIYDIDNVIIETEYVQVLMDFCDNPLLISNFVKRHKLYEPDVRMVLQKQGNSLGEIIEERFIGNLLTMCRTYVEGKRKEEEDKGEREKERKKERERLREQVKIKEKKLLEDKIERRRIIKEESRKAEEGRKKKEEEIRELFQRKNKHIITLEQILKNNKPYFLKPKGYKLFTYIYDRLLSSAFNKYKTTAVNAVIKQDSKNLLNILKESGLFVYTPVANWILIPTNPIYESEFSKSYSNNIYIYHAHAYNKGWHLDRKSRIHDDYVLQEHIRDIMMHDWDSSISMKNEKRNYIENEIYIENLKDLNLILCKVTSPC